ncbi:MAG TPA: DUF1624 domain-containing protein [Gammaproteobacteria bacterium]|nr:DUF1624 domain-containing protein [Gammaproteobacteria bacterium]
MTTGIAASRSQRLVVVDLARGIAIAMMVVFHFCFDLAMYRLAPFDFYRDPFWLHARTLILSSFLLLVGIGLVLSTRRGIDWRRFMRRLGRIVAGAAAVSVATWWMFGSRFVFFGVLHFIALASVLGLAFVRRPRLAAVLATGAVLVGNLWEHPWFDQPGRRWLGLMTYKPATEDYVPLLPWIGVVLAGIVLAHLLLRNDRLQRLDARLPLQARPLRVLARAGRHSLGLYLLHQPVLIGLIELWLRLGLA